MSNIILYELTKEQLAQLEKWKTVYLPDWESWIEIRVAKNQKSLKYSLT